MKKTKYHKKKKHHEYLQRPTEMHLLPQNDRVVLLWGLHRQVRKFDRLPWLKNTIRTSDQNLDFSAKIVSAIQKTSARMLKYEIINFENRGKCMNYKSAPKPSNNVTMMSAAPAGSWIQFGRLNYYANIFQKKIAVRARFHHQFSKLTETGQKRGRDEPPSASTSASHSPHDNSGTKFWNYLWFYFIFKFKFKHFLFHVKFVKIFKLINLTIIYSEYESTRNKKMFEPGPQVKRTSFTMASTSFGLGGS